MLAELAASWAGAARGGAGAGRGEMPEHKGAFCTFMLARGLPRGEGGGAGWEQEEQQEQEKEQEEQEEGGARCRSIKVHFAPLCLPAARRGGRAAEEQEEQEEEQEEQEEEEDAGRAGRELG